MIFDYIAGEIVHIHSLYACEIVRFCSLGILGIYT